MPAPLSPQLRALLAQRLSFYEDIGIRLFFRRSPNPAAAEAAFESPMDFQSPSPALPEKEEELLAKRSAAPASPKSSAILSPPADSLFSAAIPNDTLEKIRADIGPDCRLCRLCEKRNKIVFGDGHPAAKLMFVGEGPGRDEDAQGLPFVGRAGKLLTQMIEAMGLQRQDVYIGNVVKCRPPENRPPEKDEVAMCSPFLLRQIDVIRPQVIVALGATAARALLQTERGISEFRGQWQEFRGTKFMATYHPAYLLRNPAAKGDVWKDLQKVMAVLGLAPKKGKQA
jgi:uracil-DNA glycosylase family 4